MDDHPQSFEPEALLSHGDFIRALARSLIFDEHLTEDIVQETWLAALKKPPESGTRGTLRAWLGAVARNLSFRSRRNEQRRRIREREAARPEGYRSTEEVLAREGIRRRVVEAVLGLKEPYRSAILYRYYDDLLPKAIAERLGMPVNTVKTHIQRGLEQLRRQLDGEFEGGRKGWCLALAPFTGLTFTGTAGATAAAPTVLFGGAVMAAKVKIGIAAVILLGAVFALWQVLPDSDDWPTDIQEPKDSRVQEKDMTASGHGEQGSTSTQEAALQDREKIIPEGFKQKEDQVPFSVTVLALPGKWPVESYRITVKRDEENPEILLDEQVHDPKGLFQSRIPYASSIYLVVSASSLATRIIEYEEVHEKDGLTGKVIYLERGIEVTGIVLDLETGKSVAGARVLSLATIPRQERNNEKYLEAYGDVTSKDGRFRLVNVPDTLQTFVALHPGYADGFARCRPLESVTLELVRGFTIRGHVRKDDGSPCPGAMVRLFGNLDPILRRAEANSAGFYQIRHAAPGGHYISALGPLGYDDPCFTPEDRYLCIEGSDVTCDFGPGPDDAVLRGRVVTASGIPFPDGRLHFFRKSKPAIHRYASTDADGLYEARKFKTGSYEVEISHRSLGGRIELDKIEVPGPGIHRSDFSLPGGIITGRLIYKGKPLPVEEGDQVHLWDASWDLLAVTPDDNAEFRFQSVKAGEYHLHGSSRKYGGTAFLPVALSEDEVLSDVELVFVPKGELLVHLVGWENIKDKGEFHYSVEPVGFKLPYTTGGGFQRDTLLNEGGKPGRLALEPGMYEISLDDFELPAQRARIVEGRTTEIIFDVRWVDRPFTTLSGTLQDELGRPLSGWYFKVKLEQPGDDYPLFGQYAGPDGKFEIAGLRPGTYKIIGVDTSGDPVFYPLPYLVIPEHPGAKIEKVFVVKKSVR